MNSRDIEAWALRVIERVKARHPLEDFLVELKREWPSDATKAARRIAGHANAARGEPILWLIGVDEQDGVVGASPTDLANWWPQVQSEFDLVSPSMRDLNLSVDGQTVVALLFETDRAPYVVRNPAAGNTGAGPVEREVPWRDGTRIRSATHNDLLLLLMPLAKLAHVEVTRALLILAGPATVEGVVQYRWTLDLKFLAVPPVSDRTVLLNNRCSGEITFNSAARIDFTVWQFTGNSSLSSPTLEDGCLIRTPAIIRLTAQALSQLPAETPITVNIRVALRPAGDDWPLVLRATLHEVEPNPGALRRWALRNAPMPHDP